MTLPLPAPLDRFVAAQNAHDTEAAAACFAPDATVRDEGRDLRGADAIGAWLADTTERYRTTVTPLRLDMEGARQVVTARVAGNFPGSPAELTFRFGLDDEGRIAALEIG